MFTRVLALPERGVCASHTVLACGDHMNKCSPAFWLRRKAGLALRARCAPAFRRDSHEQMFTRVLALPERGSRAAHEVCPRVPQGLT